MPDKYIKPEDVSVSDVEVILGFLNAAETPGEIARTIEIYGERDIGIRVAERIIEQRAHLGGFTDIRQVADVEQVGPERFTEIVTVLTGLGKPSTGMGGYSMAQFKVRNLMIDVVSAELANLGDICMFPTRYCPNFTIRCPQITIDCLHTFPCRYPSGRPCGPPSFDPPVPGCPGDSCFITGGCGLNYSTCFGTEFFVLDLKRLVINPGDIGVVRDQLNQVMTAVEERGAEVTESMRPQNLRQAEFLEVQIEGALEEIRQLKDRLS